MFKITARQRTVPCLTYKDFDVAGTLVDTAIGGATSLAGSGAGKIVGGKLLKSGTSLLNKGRDKLLTGVVRRAVGQSHSSLIRQGNKYVTRGIVNINTYKGISSVVGTGISGTASFGYNTLRNRWRGYIQ